MSDLAKCIACFVLLAGIWITRSFLNGQKQEFDSDQAQKIVMVQGSMPGDGKPVLLEFWATTCGPCVQSIPHLNRLHAKFGDKVQFLAVSNEDAARVRALMKRTPMTYPVGLDRAGEFTQSWSVKAIPTMIFLDASHREQWRGHAMELTDAKLGSLLK